MLGDEVIEQAHAERGRALRHGGRVLLRPGRAGDIEMRPRRLVDEALKKLRGGDRAGMAAAGVFHVGEFGIDQLVVFRAERLAKAGQETGELVWRMPLAKEYDKLIDSKFADMKNTGGSRWGGAITAAQFIKRFVDDKTPWAHLDIAGTGFDSRQNDINKSWGSCWGVRLLNQLVADHYEK